MQRMLAGAAAVAAVGVIFVADAAYRAGTVPLPRATDELQVGVGSALVAAALGLVIVLLAFRRRIRLTVLVTLAATGALVYLSVPAWTLALFGIDPGFLMTSFKTFEWSPATRFVLFPALIEAISILLVVISTAGVLLAVRKTPIGHSAARP